MDFEACGRRDKEVRQVWRPRVTANPNDVPCYDCASNYIYQFEQCAIDSIRRGVYAHDDGWDCLAFCEEHQATRRAKGGGA